MGLRSVSAIVLTVTLSILSIGCQDSGIGNSVLRAMEVQQIQAFQKFKMKVPANTYVDQWDGDVPIRVQFYDKITVSGSFKPPAGQTLPFTTYTIQPWVFCPGKTKPLPTVPPMVTINLHSDLTFSDSFQMTFPVCSGHTMPGINTLFAGSHLQVSTAFNGDAPADTSLTLGINAKF